MSLSANKEVERKDGEIAEHPCAAEHIYMGALVKKNAAGFLAKCAAESGAVFAGIAVEEKDNSAGSAGDLKCRVYKKGRFLLVGSGFAQTDVGQPVYATDDNTITKTNAADKQLVGIIDEYVSSTKVWVDIKPGMGAGLFGANIAAVATTAATNSTPYGYSQAQADAIVSQLNLVIAALKSAKIISES